MDETKEYRDTLEFLYYRLQSFHNHGATAYKPGLERTLELAAAFGSPQNKLRVIHIGGTNGKGSTAHSVASVLQAAGLKVGLYTSPHLVDFRERIRVNGKMISKNNVVEFVKKFKELKTETLDPSFFELTTIMAFNYFAEQNVDIAVIEVGLGGRLDSTNIVSPQVTAVTNIAYDHTALLGNTLNEIAFEKAGIFKPGVKAVVGRYNTETAPVFKRIAESQNCPLVFAEKEPLYTSYTESNGFIHYSETPWGEISSELTGSCQPENMSVILHILKEVERLKIAEFDSDIITSGLTSICSRTGLMGRWMSVSHNPEIIIDTAHNPDGWNLLSRQLKAHLPKPLAVVIGFVNDKDINGIISMLPKQAKYYIVKPSVDRAADPKAVLESAKCCALDAVAFDSVKDGVNAALREFGEDPESLIFIGGSTFVVADYLSERQ